MYHIKVTGATTNPTESLSHPGPAYAHSVYSSTVDGENQRTAMHQSLTGSA